MKGVGAAAVIFNDRGEVLLVHHTYGECNWELPGGGGELGESPTETAVREVLEETGLVATPVRVTGWYYDSSNDTLHAAILCDVNRDGLSLQPDGAEISECGFWPTDALPRPYSDFTLLRIQHAMGGTAPALPVDIGPRLWHR